MQYMVIILYHVSIQRGMTYNLLMSLLIKRLILHFVRTEYVRTFTVTLFRMAQVEKILIAYINHSIFHLHLNHTN